MKTIGEIPCITAAGTPYQIGYAHGSGAKERIAVSLATYREMFWDYSGHLLGTDPEDCGKLCPLY